MSVYVDPPVAYEQEPNGYVGHSRKISRWSHMIADTLDELHTMAAKIGLRREWFQGDHYDLVPAKRDLAIRYGAVAVSRKELISIRRVSKSPSTIRTMTVKP